MPTIQLFLLRIRWHPILCVALVRYFVARSQVEAIHPHTHKIYVYLTAFMFLAYKYLFKRLFE